MFCSPMVLDLYPVATQQMTSKLDDAPHMEYISQIFMCLFMCRVSLDLLVFFILLSTYMNSCRVNVTDC